MQNGRCTNTSLRALGFKPTFTVMTASDVFEILNYAIEREEVDVIAIGGTKDKPANREWVNTTKKDKSVTFQRFKETFTNGSYLVFVDMPKDDYSSGHAMALIDGALTDTDNYGKSYDIDGKTLYHRKGVLVSADKVKTDDRVVAVAFKLVQKKPYTTYYRDNDPNKPVENMPSTDDNDYMSVINTKTGERTGKFSSFKQASSKAKALTASTGIDHAIGDWIP